jgi:universal stress protein E
MTSWQRILVIVDPTTSEHTQIDKAAQLAARCGASLQLFVCATKAVRENRLMAQRARDSDATLQDDLPQFLQTLATPLRERGLTVTAAIENAEVLHEGLLAYMQRADADLVVKETHHHSLLQRTLLTNTDWHIIRDCPLPLLLTKETPWHVSPRLLAAVDPDHANDKPAALDRAILGIATRLSRQIGGSVQAVHAYLPLAISVLLTEGMAPLVGAMTPQAIAQEVEAHRQRLRDITAGYEISESAQHLVMGTATEALPRIAREVGADIVVLGAIARSRLERWTVGSTAERVLEHLPCDALIVKLRQPNEREKRLRTGEDMR